MCSWHVPGRLRFCIVRVYAQACVHEAGHDALLPRGELEGNWLHEILTLHPGSTKLSPLSLSFPLPVAWFYLLTSSRSLTSHLGDITTDLQSPGAGHALSSRTDKGQRRETTCPGSRRHSPQTLVFPAPGLSLH